MESNSESMGCITFYLIQRGVFLMAHTCPVCGMTCHCNGDIDDICFDLEEDILACTYCSGDVYEEDILVCIHCPEGETEDERGE